MPIHNSDLTISQLYIKFGDRLKLDINFLRETEVIKIESDNCKKLTTEL